MLNLQPPQRAVKEDQDDEEDKGPADVADQKRQELHEIILKGKRISVGDRVTERIEYRSNTREQD